MPVAIATCEALRAAGIRVQSHAAGVDAWGSVKTQFKRADASGARFALIFGDDELARGEASIKNLRDADQPQRTASLADVPALMTELLNA